MKVQNIETYFEALY